MGSDSEVEKTAQKERERKKMQALAPIAKPLAGKKLCKRTLKLVRRGIYAYIHIYILYVYKYVIHVCICVQSDFFFFWYLVAAENKCLKRGVKEVVKSIRRGQKGSVLHLIYFTFLICIWQFICLSKILY